MLKNARLASIIIVFVFGVSACNLPSSNVTPTRGVDAALTAAAQTVEANMTQAAILNPPTIPVIPTSTTAVLTPTLAIPTNTQPGSTSTPICDLAQFVQDVNVPDGTEFEPNATFTKTWRLKNIGACSWSGYTLVFDSGDAMGGPATTPIDSVATNQEVDLTVNLKAPNAAGTYRGYWRIKNSAGVLIPVTGGYQSKSFFVEIKVKSPTPTATATATATTSPSGDLHIIEIILKTNFEVAVRVGTNPTGTLSGNYQYTVYSNGAQVQQGNCPVPTGSSLCSTGHIVGPVAETIKVEIDSNHSITESNEGNNTLTVTCDKFALACN